MLWNKVEKLVSGAAARDYRTSRIQEFGLRSLELGRYTTHHHKVNIQLFRRGLYLVFTFLQAVHLQNSMNRLMI